MIVDELIDKALAMGQSRKVIDVRAGLGYTCVMLEGGTCGFAYTFRNELGCCCGILGIVGNLIGMSTEKIIL